MNTYDMIMIREYCSGNTLALMERIREGTNGDLKITNETAEQMRISRYTKYMEKMRREQIVDIVDINFDNDMTCICYECIFVVLSMIIGALIGGVIGYYIGSRLAVGLGILVGICVGIMCGELITKIIKGRIRRSHNEQV